VKPVRLGFIARFDEADFQFARDSQFSVVELNCNEADWRGFLAKRKQLADWLAKYNVKISACGRWGVERTSDDAAVRAEEQKAAESLIDFCAELGVRTFVCGAGSPPTVDIEENFRRAIDAFAHLVGYGKERGVRIAVYNCRWGNFIVQPTSWTLIFEHVPDLGIKYDPSHCVYDGDGHYLGEIAEWAHKFYHFHAKGTLRVNNRRIDDPPAGMDQIDWRSVFALLYKANYDGDIVIEPHSETWGGARYHDGIRFSQKFLAPFII
jgi:sugar phosphate isomerase/epimerase